MWISCTSDLPHTCAYGNSKIEKKTKKQKCGKQKQVKLGVANYSSGLPSPGVANKHDRQSTQIKSRI